MGRPGCTVCGCCPARYRRYDPGTGRYDREPMCREHRTRAHVGRPPPWKRRYGDMVLICASYGLELRTTEQQWAVGTKREGCYFKPLLYCPMCDHQFSGTTIINLVSHGSIGCVCRSSIPWSTRYDEFIQICRDKEIEVRTTEKQWMVGTKRDRAFFKPLLYCPKCDHEFSGTTINDLVSRGSIGCVCRTNIPWSTRYDEFVQICRDKEIEVRTTQDEWIKGTEEHRNRFKPLLYCPKCDHEFSGTTINNLVSHGRIGCVCRTVVPWLTRYDEFVQICKDKDVKVRTTEEQWVDGTTREGQHFKPLLYCAQCDREFSGTTICNLVNHGQIGCGCHNKHQRSVFDAIVAAFPTYDVVNEYAFRCDAWPTSHKARADIAVRSPVGRVLAIVEVDGPHHFVPGFHYGPGAHPDGDANFLRVVKRDCLKNLHWKRRSVALLRVAYTDFATAVPLATSFVRDVLASDAVVVRVSNADMYNQQRALFRRLSRGGCTPSSPKVPHFRSDGTPSVKST